ncbi:MAG: rhomboid family intramembrane serine protease [Deltaproteobacteria bacterium]|nr:rhomboid family intramembrane serine protease [Deltaproteobacteria bacterium]MBI3076561.1 rhomboid family intramembrane serine protease [Deltaproteobacteria bacterium]
MIPLKDNIPTMRFPVVTVGLMAVNILVYLYEFLLWAEGGHRFFEGFLFQMGAIPAEILGARPLVPRGLPVPLTLVSSMFVHASVVHVGGNMLYLWIFGNNVEDSMGRLRFLAFYLLSGLVASLLHILTDPGSTVPLVGASGAIAGVLGAYFILFPYARVLTLVFFFFLVQVVRIPAMILLGFWFLMQVLSSTTMGGGIAWYAHIGGFLAGVALAKVFARRRYRWARW